MSHLLRSTARIASAVARPAMALARPALHSASPASAAASAAASAVRSFGAHAVPVGPSSNIDGVYRRPNAPAPNGPLSEHEELWWDDQQAPEPVFDQYDETNRWEALGKLLGALAFIWVGVHGVVRLYAPDERQIVVKQEFPFDNLRLSQGGPGGAPVRKE